MLRRLCGVTRLGRIRNGYARGSLRVTNVTVGKIRKNRFRRFGHVKKKNNDEMGYKMYEI